MQANTSWHNGPPGARVIVLGGLLACVAAFSGAAQRPPGTGAAQTPAGDGGGSQPGEESRGAFAGMGRVLGEVTAVAGATLSLKTEDGTTLQVVTTPNTRVMKDRGPVRISDLHPGDGVMAMGNLDQAHKTLHAAMIFAEDAAQVKVLRENLGKTYITGRVTSIDLDNARLTVERGDRVVQTIGFDETTSFRRAVRGSSGGKGGPGGKASGGEGGGGAGRSPGMGGMIPGSGMDRAFTNGESITLADIKVNDFIVGDGSVKNGTFVPARLVDNPPRHRSSNPGQTGPGSTGAAANPGPGER